MFGLGGTLVSWIGENLLAVIPVRVIRWYEGAVRSTWGKDPEVLEPGVHPFIPFRDQLQIFDLRTGVYNLLTQSVTTLDGKTWSISVNIEHMITDVLLYASMIQDAEETLTGTALGHINSKVRLMRSEDLVKGQRELESSLKDRLTTKFSQWGDTILDVRITDIVQSRAYRLFNDTVTS